MLRTREAMTFVGALLIAGGAIGARSSTAYADDPLPEKSISTANGAAAMGTLVGPALGLAAWGAHSAGAADGFVGGVAGVGAIFVVIGPTFGQYYARDASSYAPWFRLGGLAAIGLGYGVGRGGNADAATVLYVGGGLSIAGAIAYDLYVTPRRVRAYNARRDTDTSWISLAPSFGRGPDGVTTGVTLSGGF